eukprot:GHRR01017064.1.p1 GENE.GHRR01017064.1~~GHRR01017064.1.p1  ORF type:complete len:331 (+),score=129.25 GHRR01017064.1:1013-2005(+)
MRLPIYTCASVFLLLAACPIVSLLQVTTAVVVMVLDLSDPCSVLPCALRWLGLIKQKLATTYSLFERKGLQLPEQLKARQRAKLLSQHDDKGLVDCTGVSLVLACTKWDVFRDAVDAEGQKVMARTLRWLAHSYAAHLMYLGGLQPGEGAGSASGSSRSSSQHTQQQLMDNFSRLLNHTMFVGMDRKMPLKMALQFDHLGPLMIPAGSDKFKDIGRPQAQMPAVLTAADVAAIQQEWVGMASELFPAMKQQEQKERFEMDVRYREEDVDAARARREAALEAYRREMEAAKREEAVARKQKAAAGGSGGSSVGQQQQRMQQVAGGSTRKAR